MSDAADDRSCGVSEHTTGGLHLLAVIADATSDGGMEEVRNKALAHAGKMRAAMRDTWWRLESVCAEYERLCVETYRRNRELVRLGMEPTYRMPRPPLMDARIQVDGGDAYIMHTDLVRTDDVEQMARYELACREKSGGVIHDMPDTEVPSRIDRLYVGKIMRRNARCELAATIRASGRRG